MLFMPIHSGKNRSNGKYNDWDCQLNCQAMEMIFELILICYCCCRCRRCLNFFLVLFASRPRIGIWLALFSLSTPNQFHPAFLLMHAHWYYTHLTVQFTSKEEIDIDSNWYGIDSTNDDTNEEWDRERKIRKTTVCSLPCFTNAPTFYHMTRKLIDMEMPLSLVLSLCVQCLEWKWQKVCNRLASIDRIETNVWWSADMTHVSQTRNRWHFL